MPRGKNQSEPVDSRPGIPEMRSGLLKLAKRKAELLALDPSTIRNEEDERRLDAWPPMWNDTIATIFGRNSIQYAEYEMYSLNQPDSLSIIPDIRGFGGYDARLATQAFARGKAQALQTIETIERIFEERLEDAGEQPAQRAAAIFRGLPIHANLIQAIGDRYANGHYEDAVLRAYLALEAMVKAKANRPSQSGTALMEQSFSPTNPLLQIANLTDPSGRDEQMGMMRLFSGASLAVRNPRAHTLKADTADKALEQIVFLSHLANAVEAALRTMTP
jgi:uncharacterized protein (TIGR02391 family)